MAIPSSGAISLTTIQTEFGGANPISMSEYYAGGTYVPTGSTGDSGPIPTSGQISISEFYGSAAIIDTQTVTYGVYNQGQPTPPYGPAYTWTGFDNASGISVGNFGSISDGTSNIWSPAAPISSVSNQFTDNVFHPDFNTGYFRISSGKANSGWTTMYNHFDTAFPRTSASFANGASYAQWSWGGGINFRSSPATNDFKWA